MAISLNPRDAVTWNNRATVHFSAGQLGKARADLSKAIELDPKGGVAWKNRGQIYLNQGQHAQAAADWVRALELGAGNLQLAARVHGLGAELWNAGELRQAENAFRGTLTFVEKELPTFGPGSPELASAGHLQVWSNFYLALINASAGKNVEAIQYYRRALELVPSHSWAKVGLARLRATCSEPKLRDPAEALALARAAVKEMDQEAHSWSTLGLALYRTGDWKAANDALERAVALRENDPLDWLLLAMVKWQRGQKDQARQWYDRAVRWIDNTEPFLRYRLPIGAVFSSAPFGALPVLPALVLEPLLPRGQTLHEVERRPLRAEAVVLLGLAAELAAPAGGGPAQGKKP